MQTLRLFFPIVLGALCLAAWPGHAADAEVSKEPSLLDKINWTKGHQLRDRSKVKSWLFTILHREFLNIRRRAVRFPHVELSDVTEDLPTISPEMVNTLDAVRVLESLGQVQEPNRAVLSLFYMEDYSYKEIAAILEIPLGTVRSRLSRGIAQLQQSILVGTGATSQRAMLESGTAEPSSRNVTLIQEG